MQSEDDRQAVKRLMQEMAAFNEVTAECSRCHTQAALDLLRPTAHGTYCRRCLIAMPRFELDVLVADGAALEAEFVL